MNSYETWKKQSLSIGEEKAIIEILSILVW